MNEEELRNNLTKFVDNYSAYRNNIDKNTKNVLSAFENYSKIMNDKQNVLYSAVNYLPKINDAYNLSISSNRKIDELRTEIKEKESQNNKLLAEIQRLDHENQDITTQLNEIIKNQAFIYRREQLLRLTSNVHPKAADIFLGEDKSDLLNGFYSENESDNAILSIDIRRSTDLMLNANSSDDFASFITGLCEGLKKIVIMNYGVFDKFTGDGILAYFPSFYSGEDAVEKCCVTSKLCHDFFLTYYKGNRNKFKINLKTGLGIGIDYGAAKLVRINDEPTIVGVPVVYACRLSNAPSGHTYINQSAYEVLKGKDIKLNEIDVDIKNQGTVTIYDLIELGIINIKRPNWFVDNLDDKANGDGGNP